MLTELQTIEYQGHSVVEYGYDDQDVAAEALDVSYFTIDPHEPEGLHLMLSLVNLASNETAYADVICTALSYKAALLESVGEVYRHFSPHEWLITDTWKLEDEAPF